MSDDLDQSTGPNRIIPVPAPPDAPKPSRFTILNLPLVGLVRIYRLTLSPVMGMHCRFVPTCSQYALDACRWHAPPRAVWLIARRLLSCRPGGRAGYDPCPLPECRRPTDEAGLRSAGRESNGE
ncbi:MAG: membrane protein insertion efficiency factor YidD [Phycisphaerales bacterium]